MPYCPHCEENHEGNTVRELPKEIEIICRKVGPTYVLTSKDAPGLHLGGATLKQVYDLLPQGLGIHLKMLHELEEKPVYSLDTPLDEFESKIQDLPTVEAGSYAHCERLWAILQ